MIVNIVVLIQGYCLDKKEKQNNNKFTLICSWYLIQTFIEIIWHYELSYPTRPDVNRVELLVIE
jgi:hypothetical protein